MKVGHLVVFGRLDRYVGRRFLLSYARAFCLVVGLFLIIDMATKLDDYLKPGAREGDVLRYYLVQIPFIYMQMSPFILLIGGLFTAARLSKHNEIVAALNAGASTRRVFAPIFVLAVLIAGAVFLAREVAVEGLGHQRAILLDRLEEQRPEARFETFWVHADGRAVYIRAYVPAVEEGQLPEIRGLSFREQGVAFQAERAVPIEPMDLGRWRLEGSYRLEVRDGHKYTSSPEILDEVRFTPADVELAYRGKTRAGDLSAGELDRLLERFPLPIYRALYHDQLSLPLAGIVLLLVGLPFVVSQRRSGGGERIAMGFLLCVAYFGLDFACRSLGTEGVLGPVVSGWTPILFFGSLGVVLFGSMSS